MTLVLAVAAYVPALLWLGLFYTRDPRREPKHLIGTLFLLGLGATVVAALLNQAAQEVVFGGARFVDFRLRSADPIQVAQYFVLVAVAEEAVKAVFAMVGVRNHGSFDEPIDGMIYFTTVALGFAAAENFDYILGTFQGRLTSGVQPGTVGALAETAALRACLNTVLHVAWSGLVGYALSRWILHRASPWSVVGALALASLLHAVFNVSVTLLPRLTSDLVVHVGVVAPGLLLSVAAYVFLFRRARRASHAHSTAVT